MESFVRGFLRASLVWLGVGMALALVMAFDPASVPLVRPAHVHALLAGFVSGMIFGVAYHVIPRFTGKPLVSRRFAGLHFWLANGGVALLVAGWLAAGTFPATSPLGGWILLHRLGAIAFALGAGFFIYNIWRTLEAPKWTT